MYFGMFDPTIILLIPAILFTLIAQAKVKRAYKVFSRIQNMRSITGMDAARLILDANNLQDLPIERTSGELTDHYDPKVRALRLSSGVYNEATIAAVSIAAHEAGHAIQHKEAYGFLRFRTIFAPIASVSSTLSWVLLLGGIVITSAGNLWGNWIFDAGIILFCLVIVFHLVTLPVEYNASSRAIMQLQSLGIVGSDEIKGSKKVLSAAALTYVAALASAVLSLIRILLIRGRD